jgi:hypothetical protein
MLGVLVWLLAASAAPAPPSPPPVIIEVKSRALCTTLRENVRPAALDLMKNDEVIDAGRIAFRRMASDRLAAAHAGVQMDRLLVENAVAAMVRNIEQLEAALDDPKRFPANPASDDERQANALKAQLQAVEDRQKLVLNVLNGTNETDALDSMQHDFPDGNPIAGPSNGGTAAAPAPAASADVPVSAAGIAPAPGSRDPRLTDGTDLIGGTR